MNLRTFYDRVVLEYPRSVLAAVLLAVLVLGSFATRVEIDASSETLVLQGDKDLAFSREVNRRYHNPDFLFIAYTPAKGLLSPEALAVLKGLEEELTALPGIASVTSIYNAPLLGFFPGSLAQQIKEIPTLEKNPELDRERVKKVLLESPIYRDNLVSPDFKTTGLLVNLEEDKEYFRLLNRRDALLAMDKPEELAEAEAAFKAYRDRAREANHQTIQKIRAVMDGYRDGDVLFLGGVNMIVDDMITFVKSDLATYGVSVFLLLVAVMWIIFRQLRFILLPIAVMALSVAASTGFLGLFGWELTVVSSNFVSLQLIVTLSLVIHLVVRYRELLRTLPDASHREVVLEAAVSMFKPCFYVIATTVVGFSSLVVSNILPVMNLGWMMSAGVSLSLVVTFLVVPAALVLLPRVEPYTRFESKFRLIKAMGRAVLNHGNWILAAAVLTALFSASGASRLIVENSFIDYFQDDTEIYRGMEVIDKHLGGTTPLDVIIDFPPEKKEETAGEDFGGFEGFEEEFAATENDARYWFTQGKMETIEKVHETLESVHGIGKVLSFATALRVGRQLKEGQELDAIELALLYDSLPGEYKSILITPYLDLEANQARFTMRIVDSLDDLRRDALLKSIRKEIHEKAGVQEENIRLAGMMVMYNNMHQSLFDSQIKTLGAVIAALTLMFLALFRSAKVALIAITADVIAVGVVFGFMGWAGIPLDMMTITIAAISLGIAVDDAIHYLHRIKQEVAIDGDYRAAATRSHATIGYAMYYTTLAIVIGFSVLVLSNFTPTIYFGLLTVVAMAVALMANLLLLPKLVLMLRPFK